MTWATRKWKCCGGWERRHRHPGEPGWCYCVRQPQGAQAPMIDDDYIAIVRKERKRR